MENRNTRVLFATPTYDGKVHVEFLWCLISTISLASQNGIDIFPVQISFDALIQRVRNDFVDMTLRYDCDYLFFMDADQEWNPSSVVDLIKRNYDVVGFPVIKKSDTFIDFNLKVLSDKMKIDNGLIEVDNIGTGCLCISRNALQKVYDISEEYINNSQDVKRLVFDVIVKNGELVSEDVSFCMKWKKLGGKIFVDPSMTCNHIGVKKYTGNFLNFIETQNILDHD